MKTKAPRSASELAEATRQFVNQKKAGLKKAETTNPTDPEDKGKVSIPVQADAEDTKKLGLPKSNDAVNSAEPGANAAPNDSKTTQETNPAPSCAGTVPSTTDGKAEDERISNKLASLKQRMSAFLSGDKTASTAAPAVAATTADAATPEVTEDILKQAHDIYAHIGGLVCADAEGRKFVENLIYKQAGELQAAEMLTNVKQAAEIYEHVSQVAAYEQQKQAAENEQVNHLLQTKFASLSPAEQDFSLKVASSLVDAHAKGEVASQLEEAFWVKGAAAAEAMLGGENPDAAGAIPGGDGAPTPEMIMQAIAEAVAAGEITEEEAQQLLQQLGVDPAAMQGGEGAPQPSPEELAAMEAEAQLV